MISAQYDWKLLSDEIDSAFLKLAKKENLQPLTAQILYHKGIIHTENDLKSFLSTDLSDLHDPYLLNDMDKAVARIRQAIEDNELILVYGDYDADGMTSTSIMKETLDMLGAEVLTYLPNRFTDGYGPNKSVYQYFIEQQAVSLIITVDNGVAGHDAIAYAQEKGIDVIVTDHHSLPENLPDAYAIVHPEHPEANYPFKHLAGCGVAFKLATALLEEVPVEMLDLVTIGTIADMVSLTDENRTMVKLGLQQLKHSDRIGLQELLKISGISSEDITEETIGFQIAPKLNALGRLDDPNPAIELLTGFDDGEALGIATFINDKNEERKTIVDKIYQEALEMVDNSQPAQVLAKENWHPGVLGIVAGRLLEHLHQPVIVLNIEDGLAKGSARSIDSIDIFKILNTHHDLFLAFGGHSGAAGMTLPAENVEKLSQAMVDYIIANEIDFGQKKEINIDAILELESLNLDTLKNIDRLAPFGMDNKKPLFLLKDFKVLSAHAMGQDNKHLKLKVGQGQSSFDLVAFYQGDKLQEFQQAQNLELVVTLTMNKWNGNTSLQLLLEDACVNGVQLFDIRSKQSQIPKSIAILSKETNSPEVVIVDIPESMEQLQELFEGKNFSAIYFKNHIKYQYYLTGYGTRDQFAKLYKTIYQFPEFDIRYKLKELANYLKIPDILLVKMIQIFEELGFVVIVDGVMTVNKEAKKRDISESHIYQDLKKTIQFQELMALATPQEIYNSIMLKDSDE